MSSTGNQGHPDFHTVFPLWQSILHIIAMILILISYYWFSTWLVKQEDRIDDVMTTPADYTVLVTGLKRQFDKEKLKEFLVNHGRNDGVKAQIIKLNEPIDIAEYVEIVRDMNAIKSKLIYMERYVSERGKLPTSCCKQDDKVHLERKIAKLASRLASIEAHYGAGKDSDLRVGQVFVTFATKEDATNVIENFAGNTVTRFLWRLCGSGSFDSLLFERKVIKAKRAPEPSDIIWENIGASFWKKWLLRAITTLVTLIVLGICLGMIYGCTIYRKSINDSYKATDNQSFTDLSKNRMASILPALGVIAINFVLARLIRKFTSYEKMTTFTRFHTLVAVKLTIAQCVNTALLAILVSRDWEDWFLLFGLVVDMTYIFISNTVVGALVSVISPSYILKSIRRCFATRNRFLVQGEANALYEGPPVDMAQRYANVTKTLIVVLAYAPIIPLGYLFGMATLLLDYWVDKVLLIRRHARPLRMSGEMSQVMVSMVPWAVMIYAIMNFVFIYKLNQDDSAPAFIWMLITIGINFLPIGTIFRKFSRKCCWKVQADSASPLYEDKAIEFIDDYDRANPVTQREGWESLLALQAKKNIITTDAQQDFIKKLAQSGVSALVHNYAATRTPLVAYQSRFDPAKHNVFQQNLEQGNVMNVLRSQVVYRYNQQSQYHGYAIPQNVEVAAMGMYTGLRNRGQFLNASIDETRHLEAGKTPQERNPYPNLE